MSIRFGNLLLAAWLALSPVHAQDNAQARIDAASELLTLLQASRDMVAEDDPSVVWVGDSIDSGRAIPAQALRRQVTSMLRIVELVGFDEQLIARLPWHLRTLAETMPRETFLDMAPDLAMARIRARSEESRAAILADLDNEIAQASIELEEARAGAVIRLNGPDFSRVFSSTYGDIHWQKGYYGNPSKTISPSESRMIGAGPGWIVSGTWGRTDSDRSGQFEFEFNGPCSFVGYWWDAGKTRPKVVNWRGACK